GGQGGGGGEGLTGPEGDRDDDGVPDEEDNCPTQANNGQGDGDNDGVGDVCDNCPLAPNPDQANEDGDAFGDVCDFTDGDGDGVIDTEDICPNAPDPEQTDTDDDGIGDACDNCPEEPNFSQRDTDGDGRGDACDDPDDADDDGVPDATDNCPRRANPDQGDRDGDGVGNVCDNCPDAPNNSQTDSDRDGIGDACDMPDPVDRDNDGVPDAQDNCPDTPNRDQADADGDGRGDACDAVDPVQGLEVSLTWNGDGDMDLHLIHPSGAFGDRTYDLYYGNANPAWGAPGLVQDAQQAPGPEAIRIQAPARGRYTVIAHHYGFPQAGGRQLPRAELTVRCGDEAWNGAHNVRAERDAWVAVEITLPDCTFDPIGTWHPATCGQGCACEGCPVGVCYQADRLCADRCDPVDSCEMRPDPCAGVQCNAGQQCNPATGQCEGGGGECNNNNGCADFEYCESGVCQPTGNGAGAEGSGCMADNDCGRGLVCANLLIGNFCSRPCDEQDPCPDGGLGLGCIPDPVRPTRSVCASFGFP
ncbi:MAG: thrombospondin type 3 repeat-containing protein, partial [Myxococcales bacterium]|nr:thrombospondin type 3 repeat-containing protein [Myxococcales bacterium]